MGAPAWRFKGNELTYLHQVIDNGFRAGADGSFNQRLERLWSEKHNASYAITFNSCTSALHASVLALGCGPGDEVLTPALTPLMCGLCIHYTGANPVYVDSNPDTFLMDPTDLESKITSKTKAIIIVHMYGGVCDITSLMEIADRHRIPVIEDCAQCIGGKDDRGRVSGTTGTISCWSFENSKQLTCGDGGVATCQNEEIATRLRKIGGLGFKNLTAAAGKVRVDRDKFQDPEWERFDAIGYNFRLGELAAAVGLAQVEQLDKYIGLRRAMGEAYRGALFRSKLLKPQVQPKGYYYTYYTFSAKFCGEEKGISWYDFRKKHMEYGGDGIFAAAKLLHQEPALRDNLIGRGETPVAVDLQKRLMNFTTNQADQSEQEIQVNALSQTLNYFGDKVG